jgi:hypothetical protein
MTVPVLAAVLLLLPGILGGRLDQLFGLRLVAAKWVLGALIMQVVILGVAGNRSRVLGVPLSMLHVGTYVVALAVILANRRLPGIWPVGLGTLSNGLTIAVNAGTLPARPQALHSAGLDASATGTFVNSGALDNPHLWFLGDVFAIPAGLPLANVFSIGDVLILAGIALVSLRACGTRWTPIANARLTDHSLEKDYSP